MHADIKPEDIKIETFRAGDQPADISRTDIGVRITHLPTGTIAQYSASPFQARNRLVCMQMLRAALDARARQESER